MDFEGESEYEATSDLDEEDIDNFMNEELEAEAERGEEGEGAEGVESDEEEEEDEFDEPAMRLLETVEDSDDVESRWLRNRDKRETLPIMTKYEYTKMLGIRIQQIADGAPTLLSVDVGHLTSAKEIAQEEFRQNLIPFIIQRPLPDGTVELWKANELIFKD